MKIELVVAVAGRRVVSWRRSCSTGAVNRTKNPARTTQTLSVLFQTSLVDLIGTEKLIYREVWSRDKAGGRICGDVYTVERTKADFRSSETPIDLVSDNSLAEQKALPTWNATASTGVAQVAALEPESDLRSGLREIGGKDQGNHAWV
jgi:hypothetical protein